MQCSRKMGCTSRWKSTDAGGCAVVTNVVANIVANVVANVAADVGANVGANVVAAATTSESHCRITRLS